MAIFLKRITAKKNWSHSFVPSINDADHVLHAPKSCLGFCAVTYRYQILDRLPDLPNVDNGTTLLPFCGQLSHRNRPVQSLDRSLEDFSDLE
jgi:hypothetical protein